MPFVAPRPNPLLEQQVEGPLKAELPPSPAVVDTPVVTAAVPLPVRTYDSRPATDAASYAAMFMAIESQRIEVGARMDDYKYNNDMARAIEKLKNQIQMMIDKLQAEDPDKKTKLPPEIALYIWNNNISIDGVEPRSKFASLEEFSNQEYKPAQLTSVVGALDIDKSKFTDLNSQYMQQMQIALGLLQVFQQLLTSLIDSIKRVKESIASKV